MNSPEPIPFMQDSPQPLLRNIPPGAPYPIAALGPLQAAAEAVQGQTLAPMAIPAQSALAVASLACQGHADVETLGGSAPLSLYCLTVAPSGERKSSCDKPLMSALQAFEKEQAVEYRHDFQTWEGQFAIWDAQRKSCLRDAGSQKYEKQVGAQADLNALGNAPQKPPSPDRTCSEPTYEGLTRKYVEGQPTLGVFSDEGGQFLGGFAMSQDNRLKTIAALSDLWGGNPIKRTRQGDGSFTLYGRRLAIHLMVQPIVARQFLADPMASGQGFLPRFLITEPPSTIGSRFHADVKDGGAALASFGDRLRDILETPMPMDVETRELQPRVLRLSYAAKEKLIAFSDGIELRLAPGGDLAHVAAFGSKAAEQACRIAGTLTLWRDLHSPEVVAQAMVWGCELAEFYLGEAKRLVDGAIVSEEIGRAEALRKWLLESWPEPDVLPRDVLRLGPNCLRESPKARAALALLEQHGWVTKLEQGAIVRNKARHEAYRISRGAS
jgi:hypothetical protein